MISRQFNQQIFENSRQSLRISQSIWKNFSSSMLENLSQTFFFVANRAKMKIIDVIIFAQMNVKYYYDRKHQLMFMKINDYVHIRLHHDYDISFIVILNKKLNQQYVDLFKILKKMKRLIYRLKLFTHWRIHSILSITQLKSITSFSKIFFRRSRSKQSNFVFVEEDIDAVKSWKIKRLLNKRQIKRRDSKYLIRWKNYVSQYDEWRNLIELSDVIELVKNYENAMKNIVSLSKRLSSSSLFFVVDVFSFEQSFVVDFEFEKSFVAESQNQLIVVKSQKQLVVAYFSSSKKSLVVDVSNLEKSFSVVFSIVSESITSIKRQQFVVVIFRKFLTKSILSSLSISSSQSTSQSIRLLKWKKD